MTYGRDSSLIMRLLWPLCILQIIVLLACIAGTLFFLIDKRFTFIEDSIINAITSAVTIRSEKIAFEFNDEVSRLQIAHPGFWAVIANDYGQRWQVGNIPEEYNEISRNLLSIGPSQLITLPGRKMRTMRIEIVEVEGYTIHVMVGGLTETSFHSLVLQMTGKISPYFLIPVLLFTLIATPIVVIRATRGVRKLTKQVSALDICDSDARLNEHAVPKEIRPLVAAFNRAVARLGNTYRARDRFLRDAAHELRMPIAILMARIDSMPTTDEKTLLQRDLNRLSNLSEQLLDLQRLQSSDGGYALIDLAALARDAVSEIAPIASRSNELVFDAPDHPVMVNGQHGPLKRVITNLIQNALVHGKPGGTISVIVLAEGCVSVADQGDGVAEEDRDQIFQPFYRGTSNQPGYGLGLHLAQEIVRNHNGRITVSDASDGGAIFTIQLTAT